MTDKQKTRIETIIDFFGRERVESYIQNFYSDADLTRLTTKQAQKIITGLGTKIPRKPVTCVYKRDVLV